MRLLVTGGCGFIGSNFLRYILRHYLSEQVSNVDALAYAGSLGSTIDLAGQHGERYDFYRADIANPDQIDALMNRHRFYAVINCAAESHVDRSIASPRNFVHTNIVGTQVLLEAARRHGVRRFVQISTDEVYGSLSAEGGAFTEESPLAPSSPYSASKTAADLLALSYHRTYGLEVVVTRCTNNYGPWQHPEKFIPRMIVSALRDQPLPVYADGRNVRDWIHVEDHCAAIQAALLNGKPGAIYNIGSRNERRNLELVHLILDHLGKSRDLIEFVPDRPGHDFRYAINPSKAERELEWKSRYPFEKSVRETIDWYVENRAWWEPLLPLR